MARYQATTTATPSAKLAVSQSFWLLLGTWERPTREISREASVSAFRTSRVYIVFSSHEGDSTTTLTRRRQFKMKIQRVGQPNLIPSRDQRRVVANSDRYLYTRSNRSVQSNSPQQKSLTKDYDSTGSMCSSSHRMRNPRALQSTSRSRRRSNSDCSSSRSTSHGRS